jgi:poly(A)-specific ribonuclease
MKQLLRGFLQGSYVARPYNIYLNPLLDERLEIERIFSFQSGGELSFW